MNENDKNLLIPVYLNQRVVFDLLAMLDNGIATVTRVSTVNEVQRTSEKYSGENFALEKTLASLLKINAGNVEISQNEDRIHTPASLFHKLLRKLYSNQQIEKFDSDFVPQPGNIVEFESSLMNKSLVQVLSRVIKLFELAAIFQQSSPTVKQKKPSTATPLDLINDQIGGFLKKLEESNTTDIVTDTFNQDWHAILILEKPYLNDANMLDLVDGHFRIVGKVSRVLNEPSKSISLLRNTPLDFIHSSILEEMRQKFQLVNFSGQVNVPEIQLDIPAPVIQVIPIAIFA